ncbi:MAG TPA: hypothetical protein VFF73_29625 [Planctomycetota bacterium]|nr:hypothetical protein [Planctomycetota bacterium]
MSSETPKDPKAPESVPWFNAPAPTPEPQTKPQFVIKGAKPAPPPAPPDARKVIEKTTNVLGGLLNPLKAKLAAIQQKTDAPAPPPPAPAPAPAEVAEPVAADAPAEPPAQPRPTANLPRPANVTLDHLVIRVSEGTGHKAAQVLARKGIKDAKVEGDRLEFTCLSNRVVILFKTLFESHIELYGLERTVQPDAPPPG